MAIKHVDPRISKPKFESDFHFLLASLDQLLNYLMTQTADSQIDNNNISVTLKII